MALAEKKECVIIVAVWLVAATLAAGGESDILKQVVRKNNSVWKKNKQKKSMVQCSYYRNHY